MKKEMHSAYTDKSPQNNRGDLAKKQTRKIIFHWVSSKITIMQQSFSTIDKSMVLLQNMALGRFWLTDLKTNPAVYCISPASCDLDIPLLLLYWLFDCPVGRIPAQRGKHFLVFSLSMAMAVWGYMERGRRHCGVSSPAFILVRLMLFLPLRSNAFF